MAADEKIEQETFKDNLNGCSIACIDIGMHKDYVYYPLPKYLHSIWNKDDIINDKKELISQVIIIIYIHYFRL